MKMIRYSFRRICIKVADNILQICVCVPRKNIYFKAHRLSAHNVNVLLYLVLKFMEALTLEYVLENKFTPIDCIKHFNPDWTDEECDFYLWEFTCFPFSTERMIKQLNEIFLN